MLVIKTVIVVFFSLIFTYLTIFFSRKFQLLTVPQSNRWSRRIISVHGGIGIWLSFTFGLLIFNGFNLTLDHWILWLTSSVMFLVGLYDDLFTLTPRWKLTFQALVTTVAIGCGIMFTFCDSFVLNLLLTTLWVVGLNNAINLLDNMDGASSGIVFISISSLAFLPHHVDPILADTCLVLAASILGFLIFNSHPARIYMGDSGSLFLGNLSAMILLLFSQSISPEVVHTVFDIPSAFLLPVLMIFTPILDTSYVFINRKLNGFPVCQGDRGHITHRISYLLGSDRRAVLVLYAFQLIISWVIASYQWTLLYPILAFVLMGLWALTLLTNHLVWPERFQCRGYSSRIFEMVQRPLF